MAAALLVFCFRLGHEPLWLNEAYSAALVRHDFGAVVRLAAEDVHPPLYYLLLKSFTLVFGSSDAALRGPSLLGALALVALSFGPVNRIFGARASWTCAVLLVASPGLICFAQEARMYTWLAFSVAATTLYGYLAVARGARSDFVKYALTSVAAAYLHYYGLIAALFAGIGLLVVAAARHRHRLRPLLIAAGAISLAYLPWLPVALEQVGRVSHDFWVPQFDERLLVLALAAPFTYKFGAVATPWQAVPTLCLVASAVALAAWALARARQREASHALWLIVSVYLSVFLFGLVFSLCVKPILMPRYMLAGLGLFLAAGAVGLAQLPRVPWLLGTLGIVALDLQAAGRVLTETFNGPFRELSRAVEHEPAPTLVHTDMQTLFSSLRMLPEGRHVLLFPPGAKVWELPFGPFLGDQLSSTNDLGSLLASQDPILLVERTHAPPNAAAPATILNSFGWRAQSEQTFELPWSWVGFKLSKYVPAEARDGRQ